MPDDLSAAADKFIGTIDKDDVEAVNILTQKSKTKPYFAIMKILLFVWPRQRRELVAKELKELKGSISNDPVHALSIEMSEYTSLLWFDLNVNTYYQYVNRHKSYVSTGFRIFNEFVISSVKTRLHSEDLLPVEYLPSEDPTHEQIENHDNSKYSLVETVTYAMKWYPCQGLGPCDDDSWESGLQHHYCHNEHHPEFWDTQPMHWRFIVEAMYDMAAMELERRFKGQEPENKAELLVFDPRFLTRFEKTKQLTFVLKLAEYTMKAYCRRTGHAMPELPST